MFYIINSIPSRKSQADKTYADLIRLGVDKKNILIDFGYTCKDFPDLEENKRHHLLHFNLFDRILPLVVNKKVDLVYMEDSVKPLHRAEMLVKSQQCINWLGYIFHQKHFTCGVKMVYIPYLICKDLLEKKNTFRPQFIDRLIRNYGQKNQCLCVYGQTQIRIYPDESSWGNNKQKLRKEKAKARLYV